MNVTDKDIQCGEDFCLETQDEETGEWRELDEVIDNAAFNAIAYIVKSQYVCLFMLSYQKNGFSSR